jgi:hypothetical protein
MAQAFAAVVDPACHQYAGPASVLDHLAFLVRQADRRSGDPACLEECVKLLSFASDQRYTHDWRHEVLVVLGANDPRSPTEVAAAARLRAHRELTRLDAGLGLVMPGGAPDTLLPAPRLYMPTQGFSAHPQPPASEQMHAWPPAYGGAPPHQLLPPLTAAPPPWVPLPYAGPSGGPPTFETFTYVPPAVPGPPRRPAPPPRDPTPKAYSCGYCHSLRRAGNTHNLTGCAEFRSLTQAARDAWKLANPAPAHHGRR